VCFERHIVFALNCWRGIALFGNFENFKQKGVLSILIFAIQLEQSIVHYVLVYFEKLRVLFCIIDQEQHFQKFLRISNDEFF
jgi:hypothetical protein